VLRSFLGLEAFLAQRSAILDLEDATGAPEKTVLRFHVLPFVRVGQNTNCPVTSNGHLRSSSGRLRAIQRIYWKLTFQLS